MMNDEIHRRKNNAGWRRRSRRISRAGSMSFCFDDCQSLQRDKQGQFWIAEVLERRPGKCKGHVWQHTQTHNDSDDAAWWKLRESAKNQQKRIQYHMRRRPPTRLSSSNFSPAAHFLHTARTYDTPSYHERTHVGTCKHIQLIKRKIKTNKFNKMKNYRKHLSISMIKGNSIRLMN